MAQTTAAPLAPSSQESDALYFLEQFDAKHLILFEGVENPGVEAAFEKYASMGKAKLHRARIRDRGKPGMFDYTKRDDRRLGKNGYQQSIHAFRTHQAGSGCFLERQVRLQSPKVFQSPRNQACFRRMGTS